jgi:hypothetical protein
MNIRSFAIGFGAFAAILATSASLSAAPITFFGQDLDANGNLPIPNSVAAQTQFLSNIIGPQVETFESFASGTSLTGAGISVSFGPTIATMQGNDPLSEVRGVNDFGRFAVSGTQYVNCALGDTCRLTFSVPQVAFGFFGTDIGDFNGQLTLRLDGVDLVTVPHTVAGPNGSGLFFGLIDTANPFTTIEFLNSGTGDSFGFDSFTIGTREQIVPVPEPGTLALVLVGLAGMGIVRRRAR